MKPVVTDPWDALRRHTPARIALGRAGASLPTRALLEFNLAHSKARDAVHQELDCDALKAALESAGYAPVIVRSAAPDRATYLTRPDLGRKLDRRAALRGKAEIVIAVEDGLSAIAVQVHAVPLLRELQALNGPRWKGASVVVALQGRVALGDEIGERFGARLVVVLIGERPGLSSPDSLGIYQTIGPRPGRSDAERNCISNVRPQGLGYAEAAHRLDWLTGAALARGATGIGLKDESALTWKPTDALR
jgi:ethanolamine ammonia-lyase small subunit